jgi:hypothetical protein
LPPESLYWQGNDWSTYYGQASGISPRCFNFVSMSSFGGSIVNVVLSVNDCVRIYHQTNYCGGYRWDQRRVYCEGVSYDFISRRVPTPLPRYHCDFDNRPPTHLDPLRYVASRGDRLNIHAPNFNVPWNGALRPQALERRPLQDEAIRDRNTKPEQRERFTVARREEVLRAEESMRTGLAKKMSERILLTEKIAAQREEVATPLQQPIDRDAAVFKDSDVTVAPDIPVMNEKNQTGQDSLPQQRERQKLQLGDTDTRTNNAMRRAREQAAQQQQSQALAEQERQQQIAEAHQRAMNEKQEAERQRLLEEQQAAKRAEQLLMDQQQREASAREAQQKMQAQEQEKQQTEQAAIEQARQQQAAAMREAEEKVREEQMRQQEVAREEQKKAGEEQQKAAREAQEVARAEQMRQQQEVMREAQEAARQEQMRQQQEAIREQQERAREEQIRQQQEAMREQQERAQQEQMRQQQEAQRNSQLQARQLEMRQQQDSMRMRQDQMRQRDAESAGGLRRFR